MIKKFWYFVAATFNYKTGDATLYQEGVLTRYNSLLGKVVPYDYRSQQKQFLDLNKKIIQKLHLLFPEHMIYITKRSFYFRYLCRKGR
ncbi:MAG: hypothetical protein CM1200mP5_1550 [Candidatus Pelagibacterales bacterium]|nr:MAG: hypothetical protein CM1200mP5_1550 [Pelagibacterales bacterium]